MGFLEYVLSKKAFRQVYKNLMSCKCARVSSARTLRATDFDKIKQFTNHKIYRRVEYFHIQVAPCPMGFAVLSFHQQAKQQIVSETEQESIVSTEQSVTRLLLALIKHL